jgi:hypothetical protein
MTKLDIRAQITQQLSATFPGETVRAVEKVVLTPGKDERSNTELQARLRQLLTEPGPAERVGLGALGAAGLVGSAFSLVSPFNGPVGGIDARINGVRVAGARDSIASWLLDLLADTERRYLAVTGQRMVVLADRHGSPARMKTHREGSVPLPYDVLGEIVPGQLRSARLKPVLINRGRIEFYFTDGSMLAVQTHPQFTSSRAKSLLAGLGAKA